MREFFVSKNFIREFDCQLISLSSAPYNGGLSKSSGFFFMHVDKDYSGDYRSDCEKFARDNGLKNFVGFMTAVDIPAVLSYAEKGDVKVYVTAGLTNLDVPESPGTINICLIVSKGLSVNGLVSAILMATEAKAKIVYDRYRSTGTTSDAIGVFCKEGAVDWAGGATKLGMDIKAAVGEAVRKSIEKWEKSGDRI